MRKIVYLTLLVIELSCHPQSNVKQDFNQFYQPNDSITDELLFYSNPRNKELIDLNEKAVKVLHDIVLSNDSIKNDSLLYDALKDINLVISRDSNFYDAYINKAALQRRLGLDMESIITLQTLLKRKKYPEGIFSLGLSYEKFGKSTLAINLYKEAYIAYEIRLKTPLATVKDENNLQILSFLLYGKDYFQKKIRKDLKKDPNNIKLLADKKLIENFNRTEFISNF